MTRKPVDPDMPIGKMTRVKDFLPPPEELVLPEKTIKVTISLSKISVEFFKHQAKQHHLKYQKIIREVLDRYAAQYSQA